MAIDTSIRNITVEGPLFPNVSPIPKTGLHNLANTWKRQVAPVSKVISHLLNKPQKLPKKEKNHIRASKRRLIVYHTGAYNTFSCPLNYTINYTTPEWVLEPEF